MANKVNSRIRFVMSILLLLTLSASIMGKTIYVDDDAVGANDGSSWENAYFYLQDALADANAAEKPVEIRVAQGIYRPDQGAHQMLGDRVTSFRLINGVTIKGGYAGINEPDPDVWDIGKHETIFSGDLGGDDLPVIHGADLWVTSNRVDNSIWIVSSLRNDETATLDGCTITGGDLSGISFYIPSGGGGLICSWDSNPTIKNCNFIANAAIHNYGGAIFQGSPTLINCVFKNNCAFNGGALSDCYGSMNNCIFIGNYASAGGALVSCRNVTNCIFVANSAEMGGAIFCTWEDNIVVTNCTFTHNVASVGDALACGNSISEQKYPSNVHLSNCILWDGGNEVWNDDGSAITISYSNIRSGQASVYDPCSVVIWEEGNIDVDPLFADPGYWADVNDTNILVKPNDPNAVWIDGDYHLKSEAGRWDPMSESWVIDDITSSCIDAGDPNGPLDYEPDPNGGIINMGAYGGTAEASLSPTGAEEIVNVQWLGHSSVKVWTDDCIVYVDPQSLSISPHDATLVCVTHTHGDHYSPSDIARVSNDQTQFIAPPDVVQRYGSGQTIAPGQTIEFDYVSVKAVPSYNTNKPNHPRSNNWVGYIIELAGKRIYVAGDTDLIEEMKSLGDINVAILPAGGTYTMNATEAAEATEYIKPDLAIPYHWGRNVGTLRDAETFAELARCAVVILSSGETISSDNWPVYSPLIAHWALDEAEGDIAYDSAGENHGTLEGEPAWQPAGGKMGGALQFDGVDDYISTDFVLDPAKGSFSVFVWMISGVAGQAVISQADGTGSGEMWLGADPLFGKLMTGLVPPPAGRFVTQPLVSESVITDGQWHHIGFAWDGSYRILYVDGTEVAKDTTAQNPLKSADGSMYIGAGKTLDIGTFFSGLIDDVRIYNLALSAKEIEELAH